MLWFNPMTPLVQGYQNILLQGVWPPISVWLIIFVWLVMLAFLLNLMIKRSGDQLVDWL